MTSAAEVSAYRGVVDQLSLAATGDAAALLREVSQPNPVAVRMALIDGLPGVLGPYLTASSEVAAVWYEDLRKRAVGGVFLAKPEDVLTDSLFSGLARYTVGPLFGQGTATPLALLAAGVQKAVAGAGRSTIDANVSRDKTKVSYARVPKAGCCAFCAILASRGAAYGTAASAGGVVGRGLAAGIYTDKLGRSAQRGGGVKAQGPMALGNKYHNFCRCVPTPIFGDDDLPYDVGHYLDLYNSVPYGDLSGIAAAIRAEHGLS